VKNVQLGEYKSPSDIIKGLKPRGPDIGIDESYKQALLILENEQKRLQKEIETCDPVLKREKLIELGYTNIQNHFNFQNFKVKYTDNPVFEDMHLQRFNSYVFPKVLENAKNDGLFQDVFTENDVSHIMNANNKICLEVNYDGFGWLGAYGHGIGPERTLNTPKIDILNLNLVNDQAEKKPYCSMMLLDVDRPNLLTKSYEQWCHWFMYLTPFN
jgi:hypothetical protein